MENEKEILEFQVYRSVTNLYKLFLEMIEALKHDHDDQFNKLIKALPDHKDLLNQAKYLDEGQLNFIRKKILDNGNDTRRDLLLCLDNFDIKFKKK